MSAINYQREVKMLVESLSLMLLLFSSILKGNVISFFYTFTAFYYLFSRATATAMSFIVVVIGFFSFAQYFIALLNMDVINSPRQIPFFDEKNHNNYTFFPFFFKYEFFNDHLDWSYFLAMGLDKLTKLKSLWVDFLNLCLVTIFFLIYRNPAYSQKIRTKIKWCEWGPSSALID